ncbi:14063_t:CDS:2 [Dentiscutata heterogama]|uniref:14063_t:CDS:1 n=1 Tax=Dentiscutata heterogama TaxID=1316150 RepID=A0ACA9L0E3_9GLOM|nr:14063_t:CDS:2 [Dentiscutata heterogama]
MTMNIGTKKATILKVILDVYKCVNNGKKHNNLCFFKIEITHLPLSPDATYDADTINSRIFIGESYDNDFCYRFFRKKDLKKLYELFLEQVIPLTKKIIDISYYPNDKRLYNKLNSHFFVITDPSIQEIIDDNYKFFVGNNDIIPERHCICKHIWQIFLWYLAWSTGNNNN